MFLTPKLTRLDQFLRGRHYEALEVIFDRKLLEVRSHVSVFIPKFCPIRLNFERRTLRNIGGRFR